MYKKKNYRSHFGSRQSETMADAGVHIVNNNTILDMDGIVVLILTISRPAPPLVPHPPPPPPPPPCVTSDPDRFSLPVIDPTYPISDGATCGFCWRPAHSHVRKVNSRSNKKWHLSCTRPA